ncbi:MAG: NUDIX hydrolase, partial [Candidatus Helarchaeota archaeon]
MVTIPKFASSVILYRQPHIKGANPCDFEILLIQRARELKFLGGFHAFPGGKLEEEDSSERSIARCKGIDKSHAHQIIQDNKTTHQNENISIGFWIAGIRELFEEVGVLLAYNSDSMLIDLSKGDFKRKFKTYRKQLLTKELLFQEILEREELYYATDLLYYYQHFVTPDFSPIRYDARFFLAELPPDQPLEPYTGEIISTEWATPSSFLKRYRKKELKLIPPQYACLSKLRKVARIEPFLDSLA